MEITKVALVVHEGKPQAVALKERLTAYFEERDIGLSDDAELVVSLGGDGTMLRAARLAYSTDVPLLGVNLGTLGYLSEVDATKAQVALDEILAGRFTIEERVMISCRVNDGIQERSFVGLNEALVERSGTHRLVRLGVKIGGESLAAFNADGVIVATPTGSTAYALSAGGPIVSPLAKCLILVPVSAHMIFSRPFVLSVDETVEISVEGEQLASLSLDGAEGCSVQNGSLVTVQQAERPLRLLRLGGPGFVERLRVKLDLPV